MEVTIFVTGVALWSGHWVKSMVAAMSITSVRWSRTRGSQQRWRRGLGWMVVLPSSMVFGGDLHQEVVGGVEKGIHVVDTIVSSLISIM